MKLSKYSGGDEVAARAGNTFYAYVNNGETLDVAFTRMSHSGDKAGGKVVVTPPIGGALRPCTLAAADPAGTTCGYRQLSVPKTGVWQIDYQAGGDGDAPPAYWNIAVNRGAKKPPGRVWSNSYQVFQKPGKGTDLTFFYQSEFGNRYQATFRGYSGGKSEFEANAAGLTAKGTCMPINHSAAMKGNFSSDLSRCGPYKVFFDSPDPALPSTVKLPDGAATWLMRAPVAPKLGKATFTPSASRPSGGTFQVPITNHYGTVNLQIDGNNNGKFADKADRTLIQGAAASGTRKIAFNWDGRDSKKRSVDRGKNVKVRATITQAAPIYFVTADIEGRSGGIEVIHLNGPHVDDRTIYWNDTSQDDDTVSPQTVDAGVVNSGSLGGARSWDFGEKSWGDNRRIQEWTYDRVELDGPNVVLKLPQRLPKVSKDSDTVSPFLPSAANTRWLIMSGIATTVFGLGVLLLLARRDRRRDRGWT